MTDLKETAMRLAEVLHAAGCILADMQALPLDGELKGPGQLVTSADRASHDLLAVKLSELFPEVPLVMEEKTNIEPLPETYIVTDELDGTAIYAKQLPDWAVAAAYILNGRPVVGVMHLPRKPVTVVTWDGGGTWLNGDRVFLDPMANLEDNIAILDLPRDLTGHELSWLARVASNCLTVRSIGSAVASAADILMGHSCLYLNCKGAKVWDFAAASLAICEAGGVALSPDGSPLDWKRLPMGALLAGNARVAETALSFRTGHTLAKDSGA